MCGICGKVSGGRITEDELSVMTDALAHRGPDDSGLRVLPGAGLGHRRLSIIDLEGGRQPLSNEDETVWVTFNGEIYNYRELRRGLVARGHRFRTDTDTETIVHLYEERGERCVSALRGMFAFGLWDAREGKLLLARDHLGQKPLYYAVTGDELVFASEIKALLAHDPSLAVLDCEALEEYLTLRVISEPRSMFRKVRKLPPGHVLTFAGGKLRIEKYWDLRWLPKSRLREDELVEALDEEVRRAVELHLVSDVEVGAFLSGGLDSSLVVAVMSRLTGGPVKTFSVGLPYRDLDELPYADRVSRHLGTAPHRESLDLSIAETLPDLIRQLDEPADPLAACMAFLARRTRREVKVVLGGDGGDELFGGYDRYYGNRYVRYYAALPAALRRRVLARLIERVPDGFWYKSLSHVLRWIHELSFLEGGERYARSLSYFYFPPDRHGTFFGPALREGAGDFDAERAITVAFESADADDIIDRMLYADYKVRLPNHSVMILDRTTMAHGLEARSPFLDHRLAELAASVPPELKVRGRRLRYIQTRLARRYLPDEVVFRPKRGFSSALPYLMGDRFRALFRRFLPDSRLVQGGYLEERPISEIVEEHLAGRRDHGNRLWLVLQAELWYRIHIEGARPEDLRVDSGVEEGVGTRGSVT